MPTSREDFLKKYTNFTLFNPKLSLGRGSRNLQFCTLQLLQTKLIKDEPFIRTNLNLLYPRMLRAKFSWTWPKTFTFLLLHSCFSLEKGVNWWPSLEQTWIPRTTRGYGVPLGPLAISSLVFLLKNKNAKNLLGKGSGSDYFNKLKTLIIWKAKKN